MVGKEFKMREYPIPEPEPGIVLLRQELCGICGTDRHNWEYQHMDFDMILALFRIPQYCLSVASCFSIFLYKSASQLNHMMKYLEDKG